MNTATLAPELANLAKQRYGCDCCGARFESHGFCTTCNDEPLLDLADEQVQAMFQGLGEYHEPASLKDRAWKRAVSMGILILLSPYLFFYDYFFDRYPGEMFWSDWSLTTRALANVAFLIAAWFAAKRLDDVGTIEAQSKLSRISPEEWRMLSMLKEVDS